MSLINELKNVRNVKIMLVGEDLRDLYIHTVLFNPPDKELGHSKEYFKVALEKFGRDIVWMPLNQDGVLQMSILTVQDYKENKAVVACVESQKEIVVKILRYFKENCLVFGTTHAELRGVFKDDIKEYIPESYEYHPIYVHATEDDEEKFSKYQMMMVSAIVNAYKICICKLWR